MAALAARFSAAATQVFTVPLLLRLCGAEVYGATLVLLSFLTWLSMANLGLGNALTTPLSAALANHDDKEADELVSSTIALLGASVGVLLLVGLVAVPAVPWSVVLGVQSIDSETLTNAVAVGGGLSTLGIIASSGERVLHAQQRVHVSYLFMVAGNVFSLALLSALAATSTRLSPASAVACLLTPSLLAQTFGSTIALRAGRPRLRVSKIRCGRMRALWTSGMTFLGVQVIAIAMWQTDNLIVAHLFGPTVVAEYATTFRLATLGGTVLAAMVAGAWPAVAAAHAAGRNEWIRSFVRRQLRNILGLAFVGALAIALLGVPVVELWTAGVVRPRLSLVLATAAYLPVFGVCMLYAQVLNGLNLVRLQLAVGIASAAANLALSVFLGRSFGPAGVCLATGISALLPVLTLHRHVIGAASSGPGAGSS